MLGKRPNNHSGTSTGHGVSSYMATDFASDHENIIRFKPFITKVIYITSVLDKKDAYCIGMYA